MISVQGHQMTESGFIVSAMTPSLVPHTEPRTKENLHQQSALSPKLQNYIYRLSSSNKPDL